MEQSIRISVIIPAFKCAETITTALDSVRSQTLEPLEVWIVDDHSPCDVSSVVQAYIERNSLHTWHCIRLAANGGAGVARDRGARCAGGEWLAFLDADDVWHDTHLARAAAAIQAFNLDVFGAAFGIQRETSHQGPKIRFLTLDRMLWKNWLLTSTVLLKRLSYLSAGGFEPGRRYSEDYRLWLKLCTDPELRMGVSPDAHAIYGALRIPTTGLSSQLWRMESAELSNFWWLRKNHHISATRYLVASLWSLVRYGRRVVRRALV